MCYLYKEKVYDLSFLQGLKCKSCGVSSGLLHASDSAHRTSR